MSDSFVTPWTVACQAPLSMGLPNTGVGCYSLLQGIFLTKGLNLCLLHWQADSLSPSHLGTPYIYVCICAYITESLCCTAEINIINQISFNKNKLLKIKKIRKKHKEGLGMQDQEKTDSYCPSLPHVVTIKEFQVLLSSIICLPSYP